MLGGIYPDDFCFHDLAVIKMKPYCFIFMLFQLV